MVVVLAWKPIVTTVLAGTSALKSDGVMVTQPWDARKVAPQLACTDADCAIEKRPVQPDQAVLEVLVSWMVATNPPSQVEPKVYSARQPAGVAVCDVVLTPPGCATEGRATG